MSAREGAKQLGAQGDGERFWNSCCGEGNWGSGRAEHQTEKPGLEGVAGVVGAPFGCSPVFSIPPPTFCGVEAETGNR